MSDIAIKVENVSKKYRLGERGGYRTIRESLSKLGKIPARWFKRGNQVNHTSPGNPSQVETAGTTALADAPGNASDADLLPVSETADDGLIPSRAITANSTRANDPADPNTFWALRDVSFEVKRGEVLGIIGRNGAGKSTLLKILSRITEPTTGRIDLYGRVASLLEVGTGFHPELTGRENIYLNGAILGMTRVEINRQFDAIIDFAGVEKFLDTPVKRYSSGMRVRLGFAVAAHLEPEILIVDEVLAVGDQEFQNKCLGKMDSVARSGRTVLFVSHNMAAVANLCTRAIRLDAGAISTQGSVDDVVNSYLQSAEYPKCDVDLTTLPRPARFAQILMTRFRLRTLGGEPALGIPVGGDGVFEVRVEPNPHREPVALAISIIGSRGDVILKCSMARQFGRYVDVTRSVVIACSLRNCRLIPGRYGLSLTLQSSGHAIDVVRDGLSFEVQSRDIYGTGDIPPQSSSYGYILPEVDWATRDC